MPAGIRLGMSSTDPTFALTVLASSRASSLPQVFGLNINLVFTEDPMWERACSRRGQPRHHKIQN